MKKYFIFKKILLLIVSVMISFSCVKDTNFDQTDPLVLTPIVEVNLIEIQETAVAFLDDFGVEVLNISDLIVFDVFSSDFVDENLLKAELVYEVTNTLNKAFEFKMEFYDLSKTLQHTISFNIENSPTNKPLVSEHTEVFDTSSLEALKRSSTLDITITLLSSPTGSVLTTASKGMIALKSKGVFYLQLSE
tara:strand:+ start:4484 stop:5056 length:573 start_codon:yes stop_codon:yes gene_type:complete